MKYLDLLRTYRTEPLFTLEDLRGRFPHVKPQTLKQQLSRWVRRG